MEYNESPLLLLVNCEMASEMRDLPVYVYETVLHIVEDLPVMAFARVPYRIESEEVCLCVMLGSFIWFIAIAGWGYVIRRLLYSLHFIVFREFFKKIGAFFLYLLIWHLGFCRRYIFVLHECLPPQGVQPLKGFWDRQSQWAERSLLAGWQRSS